MTDDSKPSPTCPSPPETKGTDDSRPGRSDSDHSEIIRKLWQHEDMLANHRITWFTTTQGLLFAALAIAYKKEALLLPPLLPLLGPILISVGLGSCALSFASLLLGAKAKADLRAWWKQNRGDYKGPPVVGYYPDSFKYLGYFAPSNLLPVMFSIAWSILALKIY